MKNDGNKIFPFGTAVKQLKELELKP